MEIVTEHWGVTANIKRDLPFGEGGYETRIGTRQFRGGAKVYIIGSYPGMCDNLIVIGQNKHTNKYIRSVVRVSVVENMRVKLIYGKSALNLLQQEAPVGASMIKTEAEAVYLFKIIPQWCEL